MVISSLTLCPSPDLPGSGSFTICYYRAAAQRSCGTTRASNRVGQEPTIIHKIQPSRGWELARARVLGRAYAVAPGRWLEGAAAAITSVFSIAWGAKRERSASTHAMRCRFGEPCM
eukprot:6213339-Pleurochrysis_carterae.AAC.1